MEISDKVIKILLVEDDISLGYLLTENLKAHDISVTLIKDGHSALEVYKQQNFDLCIIDVMLPGIDGFALAAELRKGDPAQPFIFLTSLSQDKDKHLGFETGADDYITKPFNFKELYYRILAVLRRYQPQHNVQKDDTITLGTLTFNPVLRELKINNNEKKISHREASLLHMLLLHCNNFVNRYDILNNVWGTDNTLAARSMEVYITRLRKLLKEDPAFKIENLYGEGYRILYSD